MDGTHKFLQAWSIENPLEGFNSLKSPGASSAEATGSAAVSAGAALGTKTRCRAKVGTERHPAQAVGLLFEMDFGQESDLAAV